MSRKAISFQGVFVVIPFFAAQAQDLDVSGNLNLVNSTPTAGNILKAGVPFVHNFGTNNTFIGSQAGNLNMRGVNNTASGAFALSSNASGTYNTATGVDALWSNTEGAGNTANGNETLLRNTIGSYNTAIGISALENNTEGIVNTATGAQALQDNIAGGFNTASGVDALWHNTKGNFNTATGMLALQNNTTGNGNTGLGAGADVSAGDLTNATAIGRGAVVNASNKIRLGNEEVTVIEGQVGFTSSSDRDQKENFQSIAGEEVLTKIRKLSITSWNFIGQDVRQFRHYGPAAEDFFAAFGHDGIGTIGTPTTLTSTDVEGILMAATQALEERTAEQRKQLDVLRSRLEALERAASKCAVVKAEE